MLVKDWMSKNLVTVKANDSVVKAQTLLLDKNISRLPGHGRRNASGNHHRPGHKKVTDTIWNFKG
jgi:predicted transcriptional regulator